MQTNKIALITDSTCDIPSQWREQYNIQVVPLTIIWGDRQLIDGVDISPEEFYQQLPQTPYHPTTSQPSPQLFQQAYQAAIENGANEIITFTLSSAMSGTIQSAKQAAENISTPIHFVDSKTNSMGLGWQVIAAARALEAGKPVEKILEIVEKARKNMAYYISLDTLEFLVRGGRMGGAAKFIGSLLNIKPLIYVNHETGQVGASIPARSRVRAIEGLFKEFFNHVQTDLPLHITILHNGALEEAEALAERVRQEFNPVDLFISYTSPILGAHTGPRAIALCGYAEEAC